MEIKRIVEKATELYYNGPKEEREPGFHASSAGSCFKKVVLETLFPKRRKPMTKDTKTVLSIGHLMHKRMDDVLRQYAERTGELIWIQPFRLKSFAFEIGKVLKDADLGKDSSGNPIKLIDPWVWGTPDGIWLNVETGNLLIPDWKTTNSRAFSYKVKGSKSNTHGLQLGTYIPPIIETLKAIGLDKEAEEASIIYLRKDDLVPCYHEFNIEDIRNRALVYWVEATQVLVDFAKTGGAVMPEANPPEAWMCDYCSMFANKRECLQCQDLESFNNLRTKQGELL